MAAVGMKAVVAVTREANGKSLAPTRTSDQG